MVSQGPLQACSVNHDDLQTAFRSQPSDTVAGIDLRQTCGVVQCHTGSATAAYWAGAATVRTSPGVPGSCITWCPQ